MRDQIQNFVQSRFRFASDQHGLRQCARNLTAINPPQVACGDAEQRCDVVLREVPILTECREARAGRLIKASRKFFGIFYVIRQSENPWSLQLTDLLNFAGCVASLADFGQNGPKEDKYVR